MINSKFKNTYFFWVSILLFGLFSCGNTNASKTTDKNTKIDQKITPDSLSLESGAYEIIISKPEDYRSLIKDKVIGIIANQTSTVKNSKKGFTHLIDTLISLKINIKSVFSPEHGFRGKADAGEHIATEKDSKTELQLISLYGENRKPTKEQMRDIEIMIFDIQDVGVRFYTYISTLHYIMEACAEANIPLLVIDRPNPNGHYIDGPVLEPEHKSFVGMHPVPIVYGMTIGEYAQMINGEKWLKNDMQCDLTVLPLKNYTHQSQYSLPIKPSPNLPNDVAINLYPSLCLFEGTTASAGRGTEKQFQIFGAPYLPEDKFSFQFTPEPNNGSKHPKFKNELCQGKNLQNHTKLNALNLNWVIEAYQASDKKTFFNSFITKLAGTKKLQDQIKKNISPKDIKKTWKSDLQIFKDVRLKYLIYK